MKKAKKKTSIFKIIALSIAFILLSAFICLYIYLRFSTPQKDGLFIPPSEKKIVRLLEENSDEMEYVKDYAIAQESFWWRDNEKDMIDGKNGYVKTADISTELAENLEKLYNAGFRLIRKETDGICFMRWNDLSFSVGVIYTENPDNIEQEMKNDKYLKHVHFKETGKTNWYYYNYDYID